MITFILGGARSGKSSIAENIASTSELPIYYLATAQAWDSEMTDRIHHHQKSRPSHWPTLEVPLDIVPVIKQYSECCLLLDCLTLWLTNLLLDDESRLQERKQALLDALSHGVDGHLILVSNEVGQGIVPANALSRRFVDESGRLHQEVAHLADRVILVTAGIPQFLKGQP